ncbi:MAG: hypothetical protein ACTSSH_10630, partial [Candidatus Heimdallarchaeota archaeon]
QYIFNPSIRDVFMNKISRGLDEILLIVDECHNIIDTSIGISSDQLSIYSLRQALKEIKTFGKHEFLRLVRALIDELEEKQQRTDVEMKIDAKDLLYKISREIGATIDLEYADKFISAGMKIQKENLARNKPPRSFLHRIGQFLNKFIVIISPSNRSIFE